MSSIASESAAPVVLPYRARAKRFAIFATTGVVLAVSVAEFISLLGSHMIGPEWYGVLVAGLAVVAGILSLSIIALPQRRTLAMVAVLILWAIVALAGIAGTYYHVVGVAPEYGPVDPRPRPALSPLIFTVLALAGGAALFIGQRTGRPTSGR